MNFLKGPCSWDIALFLALIDRLIIWTLYNINNCPFPPTLRARGSSRVAFPSRWPWTLCSSGHTWHGWLWGQCCHTECRAFATWLTSECWLFPARAKRLEKDLVGSPWKVKKKSPAFGEEKNQLNRTLEQDGTEGKDNDFGWLPTPGSSLSLGIFCLFHHQWSYCFSWRGTRMFFQPLPCS